MQLNVRSSIKQGLSQSLLGLVLAFCLAGVAGGEIVGGREVGPCIGRLYVGLHGDWIVAPQEDDPVARIWFYKDGDGLVGRKPWIESTKDGVMRTSEELLHVSPDGRIHWSGPMDIPSDDRKWQPTKWPLKNGKLLSISKLPKGAWVAQEKKKEAKAKRPENAIHWCWMLDRKYLLGAPAHADAIGSVCWLLKTETGFQLSLDGNVICSVDAEKRLTLLEFGAAFLQVSAKWTLYWPIVDLKDTPTLPGDFSGKEFHTTMHGNRYKFSGRKFVEAIQFHH